MFRRSRTSTDEESGQDAATGADATSGADTALANSPAVTAGKGRPTPKRSEAERRRRQPYTAPKDRKEAARFSKDRQRSDRTRRMEAVRRGEEWALPPRDRGPVKALARDYVDSRRHIGEFLLPGMIVILAATFAYQIAPGISMYATVFMYIFIATVAVSSYLTWRGFKKLLAERLPRSSYRGLLFYVINRSIQIRRFRMPAPRVKRGDSF